MGRPKALLDYKGKTFLEHILDIIAESPIEETVVVLGAHREAIQARVAVPNWVYNPDFDRGMTTSLQAGIRAVRGPITSAMLFLVDHPAISVETVRQLAARASSHTIAVPVTGGRRGHPVLFGRQTLLEILELPGDCGANEVVRAHPERVTEVAVEDSGILMDVDTPDDFGELGRGSA